MKEKKCGIILRKYSVFFLHRILLKRINYTTISSYIFFLLFCIFKFNIYSIASDNYYAKVIRIIDENSITRLCGSAY